MSLADPDPQAAEAPGAASEPVVAGGYWADLRGDTVGMIGVVSLGLLFLIAIFAPLIAPYDPAAQNIIARLKPPVWLPGGSWEHILGTDHLGRDVLSRLLNGSRISLFVGFATVLLAGSFGVMMGLISGYAGGKTDQFITAVTDTQVAFPGLLLALLILAVIGPSTVTVIVVLALNGWM
ncbi:MAG: ABC transporter permease, partial [Pseudomonadota bacterium]